MADEIVTIRIDFKTNKKDMASALAQMRGLDKAADNLGDSNEKLTNKTNKMKNAFADLDEPLAAMNKRMNQLRVGGQRFERNMSLGQKAMLKFQRAARLVFFALVALVGEFVITAATLASVNLAFKAGQWALKAYNVSLGLVGAALASVVAGVTVAIAAFKEYQAALVAFQYKGANIYGSAIGASSAAMRTLTTDTNLATMGVQQLTQAYTAMARSAKVTAVQSKALSGAMDFLAGAEDQGKSFQAMANFVGLLTKNKKVTSEVSAAASGVSKEFAKAVAGQKDKSAGGILASMASGDLAAAAGLKGGFDALKSTVVAQFKQYTTFLARDFSDFGEFLLNDLKEVMNSYFKTIRDTFAKLTPEFMAFAKGPLFKSLITMGDAIGKFAIVLMRKYLPMIQGAGKWLRDTFFNIQKSFNQFVDSLEKFRKGSEIITKTFKGPILAVFRIFGRNAEQLGYLAEDNEDQFLAWGKSLETLIFAIGDFFAELKVAFTEALPVLTAVVNALAKIISFMGNIIGQVGRFNLFGGGMDGGEGRSGTIGAGLGPGVGSLLTLGLMFGAYKGRRFAYRDRYYSTKDPGSMASAYATRGTPRSFGERMFGSAPRMFSKSYWTGGAVGANEYAASMAVNEKRMAVGMDPRMGYYMGGLGPDKMLRDPVTGQRIGFRNVADYRNYMANDPRASATTFGASNARALQHLENNLRASGMSEREIQRRVNAKAVEQLSKMNDDRAMAFGGQNVQSLFRTDQSTGQRAGLSAFGGRNYGQRMEQMTKMRTKQGRALNRAYKEFVATEQAGRKRFSEGDAKSYRAFARAHGAANIKGRFAGVGEAAQASMRGMFNPMMGMAGGMLLSTGVTERIGDEDFRKATNNALGLGAMFGTRGMLIAGGAGLMGSTSTGKAALGGAMAGLAVGKTISDMVSPVLGPAGPMAKALILGGSALVGGVVGAFKAQGNRERAAGQIGKEVGNRLIGRAVATMIGAGVDPVTGRIVKKGPGGFKAMQNQLARDRSALASAPAYSFTELRTKTTAAAQNEYVTSSAARQIAFIDRLHEMGVMTDEQYATMQKIAGNRSNSANQTRQSMIDSLGKEYLGYTTDANGNKVINDPSMLAAEKYFKGGVRGKLSFQEGAVIGKGQMADIMAKRGGFVVQQLMNLTGQTEEEIMRLASKLNVNLADPLKNMTTVIGELGLVTRKTVEEMNVAIRDLAVESLKAFDEEIAQRQTVYALDASFNALVQAGGAATIEDFADYARTQQQFFATTMGDDPLAYLQALKDFSEGRFQSGAMSPETFAAFTSTASGTSAQEVARTAYGRTRRGMATLGAQQFTGALLESNAVFKNAGANEALTGAIDQILASDKYTSTDKKVLLEGISSGNFVKRGPGGSMSIDTEKLNALGGAGRALADYITTTRGVGDAGRRGLGEDMFGIETSAVYQIEGEVTIYKDSIKEIAAAIQSGFDFNQEVWENAPEWWQQMINSKWEWSDGQLKISGDTRSSRRGAVGDTRTSRALRGTMASHARFNSLLTGTRNVTSSLRFDNLGSMSSDHAAGRAYDLVGQNLGQYQKLVTQAGGFAEFHGRGGSRHLHVVPPIGGTRTSRVNQVGEGGMTQNVTVNVYGAPGQSETVIARHVVSALAEHERAYRERS